MVALRKDDDNHNAPPVRTGRVVGLRVPTDGPYRDPTIPPRVRADALPEHTTYRDTGCELSPSCLRCPLARCKYDQPGGARRLTTDARDREIATLRRRHRAPIDMLAGTYRLSRRSIFRILREHRGP